jgi:hypothetical protein
VAFDVQATPAVIVGLRWKRGGHPHPLVPMVGSLVMCCGAVGFDFQPGHL